MAATEIPKSPPHSPRTAPGLSSKAPVVVTIGVDAQDLTRLERVVGGWAKGNACLVFDDTVLWWLVRGR